MSIPAPISERLGCPTCGAVFRQDFGYCPLDHTLLAELDHDPLIGTTLADRYVIECCVGEGGMGRVYRARHRKLDRLFAVKVLYGDLAASAKMRSRFEREAKNASKLQHPRLVSVVDFDITAGGLLYLAMNYVEGRELATIIVDEAPLEATRAARLLRQLCEGLGYAHDQGMVHRDFKGQNVLVSGQGANEDAYILDFGLAFMREEPESSRLTTQGVVMGTPAYMSPEQAMNQALDQRTDLFSLGVLLYEMLAGTLPFTGTPVEVARQNMAADPPPISQRVPGLTVDPALESIAFRLMEKLPRDRFQSAQEVIDALDALAASREAPRSASMHALSPRNAVDTAGITQDIHVIIQGGQGSQAQAGDLLGATHGMEQVAPGPSPLRPGRVRSGQNGPAEAHVAPVVPAKNGQMGAAAPAPMQSAEPKGGHVRTERVRPRRAGPRALAIGVIVAALLALLIWRFHSGSAPPAEPEAARLASSGTEAPGPTAPAARMVPRAPTEPAAEVPAQVAEEPAAAPGDAAAATPAEVPAASTRGQRPRTRPAGASTKAAAPERNPKTEAPSNSSGSSPSGGQEDKPLEKPLDEAAGPDLVTLYERVGQKLAAFETARGRDAAAELWALYRTIPLADALRTPSLGQEAIRKLRKIERDLKRGQSRPK